MSRVEIPVYAVNRDAYAPYAQVTGDSGNGHYFATNRGRTFIEVENSGTVSHTIGAVIAGNSVDEIAVPNKDLTVEGGSVHKFGPFPTRYYSQDDSSVWIDVDSSELLLSAFSVSPD